MDDLNVDTDMLPSKMELFDRLDNLVDIIIDTGEEPKNQVSTILDLTDDQPIITRKGMGWEAVAAWI
jgi:tRNA A37 threonylcarbamoyladenosine synthetase subunit TsaC/SUA5/YrdC